MECHVCGTYIATATCTESWYPRLVAAAETGVCVTSQNLPNSGLNTLREVLQVRIEHAEHGLLALIGGRLQLRPEAPHLHSTLRY